MSYTGHCNCESIRITLPQQPPSSILCHWCVPPRAHSSGSGRKYLTSFSVNYLVPENDMVVEDSTKAMNIYNDNNTASGNVVQRHFCSNCGRSPSTAGQIFLKASLFDTVSASGGEVFGETRLQL
ncbi:uncharacterized protein N7459_002315 [Penicillium hispanicum]|uniref:uncharacterized protein n=1 Tax=Penicillium hispanicum TaxID=1080232 RepID=UPI002541CA4D|nr:uncharacterized protein N7459_002315 [Penicillium hispanicum]KAJ5591946.1 hypothetical protein N7459_002315 [Penicillium hispanicum]